MAKGPSVKNIETRNSARRKVASSNVILIYNCYYIIFLKKNWERVGFVITVHLYSIMDSVAYNLKKRKHIV